MADEYSVIDSPIPKEENAEGEYLSPLYEEVTVNSNDVITSDTKSAFLENTNTEVTVEANICYQANPRDLAARAAAKNISTAHITSRNSDAADEAKSEDTLDVSCKRFIWILVTITLISLVFLIVLVILFSEVTKLKNRSASAPSQQMGNDSIELQLINQNLVNIQQLNDSIDLILQQLSIIHSQTQQLTNSNTMLQQQLTSVHNQTQQPNDSITMLQQQITTLHNQTQRLNESNTMLRQEITTLNNQTQQLNDSNTMLRQEITTLSQQLNESNTMLQKQLTTLHNQLSDSNTMLEQRPNATSCAALPPSSPSGYYWVRASNGSPGRTILQEHVRFLQDVQDLARILQM